MMSSGGSSEDHAGDKKKHKNKVKLADLVSPFLYKHGPGHKVDIFDRREGRTYSYSKSDRRTVVTPNFPMRGDVRAPWRISTLVVQ